MSITTLTARAIGGPTMLLEYAGLRLLTDPTFDPPGEYPRKPGGSLHKTTGPTMSAEEIGAVDAVLLSHDHHSDNLDHEGRRFLPQAKAVITTIAGAERLGGNAASLAPWQSTVLQSPTAGPITVTAVPAQHGPDGTDHLTGPVIGFALRGAGLPSLYISGDNASLRVVEEIVDRLGHFDIAVLFTGGARVAPIDGHLTLPADQAPAAARTLGVHAVIPNHFDGWAHFTHGFAELESAFAAAGMADRLLPAIPGATVQVAFTREPAPLGEARASTAIREAALSRP